VTVAPAPVLATPSLPAAPIRKRRLNRKTREALLGYALILPALVVFGVFIYYPFIRNFYLGFHQAPLFGAGVGKYVGLDQWKSILDLDTLLPLLALGLAVSFGVTLVLFVVVPAVRSMARRGRSPGEAISTTLRTRSWTRLALAWLIIAFSIGLWVFTTRSDTQFARGLATSFALYLMMLPAILILGTLLAVLAHRVLKGVTVFRTLFMMSLATGVGVAGTIFFTLLNPQVGLLPWLGLDANPAPLENPTWARPSVAIFVVWLEIGLAFIILLAGLQGIPDDLYEAARVDGAGPMRRFWQVTVPMLSPTLLFVFVVGSIFAITQSFPYVDVTTGGGPLGKTQTLPWSIVDTLRGTNPDRSRAAILSVALFVITLVFTMVQLTVLERRVHYGGGERG